MTHKTAAIQKFKGLSKNSGEEQSILFSVRKKTPARPLSRHSRSGWDRRKTGYTLGSLTRHSRTGDFSDWLQMASRPFLRHSRRKHFNSGKGQVTVELILLAVVLIFLSQLVINQIKNNKYIEDFAKGPSQVMANMIANGNWQKEPSKSREEHPNLHERHYSWDPL